LQLVANAAITPNAANHGAKTAPITPTVAGISSSFSRLILDNYTRHISLMQQLLDTISQFAARNSILFPAKLGHSNTTNRTKLVTFFYWRTALYTVGQQRHQSAKNDPEK
jgi:hypothetical protein